MVKFAEDVESIIKQDVFGVVVGYPLLESGRTSKLCEEIHHIIFEFQSLMNVGGIELQFLPNGYISYYLYFILTFLIFQGSCALYILG